MLVVVKTKLRIFFFSKNKDYFITSINSFLKMQSHIVDLKNYKDIKRLSDSKNQINGDNNFNYEIDKQIM